MSQPSVTYVLAFSGLAGGVAVILHHAADLRVRGWDCQIFSVASPPAWWAGADPGWRQFSTTDALGAALRARRGCKVACYNPHASWVWENLGPDDRGFVLFQDFDGETYQGQPHLDEMAARRLQPITESAWVTEELRRRYGVTAVNVGIGINPVFRPLPMVRDPLRVVAPARTHSAGRHDLKGWDITRETLQLAAAKVPGVSLVTFGIEDVPPVGFLPHVHLRHPNDRKLRELFASAGAVLVASRHEGFGLVQAEAMACGAAVVCTDAHGNREFTHHGRTCLVANDPTRLAHWVAEVCTDRTLATRLGRTGQQEVSRYRWPDVIGRLERLFTADTGPSLR